MNTNKKLSDEEFASMVRLLKRYAETEMDQWELWKFSSSRSKIYISVSMYPSHKGAEDSYTDLDHLIE